MSDLNVLMGDLLGCGLFHDGVLTHDVPLDVSPSYQRLRRLGGRRDSELLDVSQRAGRRRLDLLDAVDSRLEPVPLDDGRLVGRLHLLDHTNTTQSKPLLTVILFHLFHFYQPVV